MQLSDKQQEAANLIYDWYHSKKQSFYLAGYAGTGKTTSVNEVVKRLGSINVVYCAFTGKAASVLRSKGNSPATTVHSLIYQFKEDPITSEKIFIKRPLNEDEARDKAIYYDCNELIYKADLIVLDECSMISTELYDDLRSFDVKILILGDPGQLPPVKGTSPFGNPDYILTEIHRQAADSNILTLATKARQGEKISYCEFDDACVIPMKRLEDIYETGTQVLCGLNKKRFLINSFVRKKLFPENKSHYPLPGEMIMCLKNSREHGIFNGQFFTCITHELFGVSNANDINYDDLKEISLTVKDENENILTFNCDFRYFKATSEKDDPVLRHLKLEQSNFIKVPGIPFDFAHCITVHKSQGSQWDKVILIDESKSFRADKNKWLYTGITRAAKKIWILK